MIHGSLMNSNSQGVISLGMFLFLSIKRQHRLWMDVLSDFYFIMINEWKFYFCSFLLCYLCAVVSITSYSKQETVLCLAWDRLSPLLYKHCSLQRLAYVSENLCFTYSEHLCPFTILDGQQNFVPHVQSLLQVSICRFRSDRKRGSSIISG